MREFADNNNVFFAMRMLPFFMNKGFYPWMSFNSDTFTYKSTQKCLLAYWAEDITEIMKNKLIYIKEQL